MVVRMRTTRSRTGNRRSHHALQAPIFAVCKNCGENYRPHHMCQACGFYKGRVIIDMKAKNDAREARKQAKRNPQTAAPEDADTDTNTNESASATEEKSETRS